MAAVPSTAVELLPPATACTHAEIGAVAPSGTDQQQEHQDQPVQPACFVIMHSVSKKHNIGTIARCATAFGVKQVCLVGSRQYNAFGSHGSDVYVDIRHFPTLHACVSHLKEVEKCEIVGIEITPNALPVHRHPFSGSVAFMLGNEGQGLSPKQMALCDRFIYIPQHGCGTASLNVAVATSIVLHHFAIWAGFPERHREGHKFVVAERPQRIHARGVALDHETVETAQAVKPADAGEALLEEVQAGQCLAELFTEQ